jgi:transcriptional regulator with XRE-family HTH domain
VTCTFREWRQTAGLTLEEVSDLTGITISVLSRVERGQRNLRPMTKVRVARRLGVPISALFPVEREEVVA